MNKLILDPLLTKDTITSVALMGEEETLATATRIGKGDGGDKWVIQMNIHDWVGKLKDLTPWLFEQYSVQHNG